MSVTSLIIGLDVSPRRLGWGLVHLVTGEPVACGMEPIDLPDHGWSHVQVSLALGEIPLWHPSPRLPEVQAVYIECPISRFPGMAYDEGRAVGMTQGEVERRWPHAPIEYLMPSEWRKLACLRGNASKADVMDAASALFLAAEMRGAGGDGLDIEHQDAADALLIAVAGWHRNQDTWERAVARGAA